MIYISQLHDISTITLIKELSRRMDAIVVLRRWREVGKSGDLEVQFRFWYDDYFNGIGMMEEAMHHMKNGTCVDVGTGEVERDFEDDEEDGHDEPNGDNTPEGPEVVP